MTIRERILKYIDYKGITKYRFYKETGLSNGFLDKEGAIGSDKCEIICAQYPDLDPKWLLLGEGVMIKETSAFSQKNERIDELLGNDDNSIKTLVDKIIELSSENALLKAEVDKLKCKIKPYEESYENSIAAEPQP